MIMRRPSGFIEPCLPSKAVRTGGSQSPAQHSAGNDIFRFGFSRNYDPKSRAHLADLFGAYCREILNTIPTNTPGEKTWVAEEFGATNGERLNRLVETKEWARHRLKEVFSKCVNEAGGVCLVALLAGIGFTMSIFIAMLAFTDERLLNAAKLGVLLGSLVSATLGLGWGARYAQRLRRAIGNNGRMI